MRKDRVDKMNVETKNMYSEVYSILNTLGDEYNENKYQTELNKKYNPDNIFKTQNKVKQQDIIDDYLSKENIEKIVTLTEYKESIFKKFINKIKDIFHIGK